jgi:hypothetical protein
MGGAKPSPTKSDQHFPNLQKQRLFSGPQQLCFSTASGEKRIEHGFFDWFNYPIARKTRAAHATYKSEAGYWSLLSDKFNESDMDLGSLCDQIRPMETVKSTNKIVNLLYDPADRNGGRRSARGIGRLGEQAP